MYGFHYRQIALIRSYYLPNIVEGIANARVSSTTSSVGSDDLGRISCHQMLSNGTHYIDQRHWGATSILLFLYKVTREGVFNHTNLLVRSHTSFQPSKIQLSKCKFLFTDLVSKQIAVDGFARFFQSAFISPSMYDESWPDFTKNVSLLNVPKISGQGFYFKN